MKKTNNKPIITPTETAIKNKTVDGVLPINVLPLLYDEDEPLLLVELPVSAARSVEDGVY